MTYMETLLFVHEYLQGVHHLKAAIKELDRDYINEYRPKIQLSKMKNIDDFVWSEDHFCETKHMLNFIYIVERGGCTIYLFIGRNV